MKFDKKIFLIIILVLNMLASFLVSELLLPKSSADVFFCENELGENKATLSIVTPIQKTNFILKASAVKRVVIQKIVIFIIPFTLIVDLIFCCFMFMQGLLRRVIYTRAYVLSYKMDSDGEKWVSTI